MSSHEGCTNILCAKFKSFLVKDNHLLEDTLADSEPIPIRNMSTTQQLATQGCTNIMCAKFKIWLIKETDVLEDLWVGLYTLYSFYIELVWPEISTAPLVRN